MPSKNTIKLDAEQTYYHIYARGASKQTIFLETADFHYFQKLFARYLSAAATERRNGPPYPHYANSVHLLAFCLMSNHFHCLVFQKDKGAMAELMRALLASYCRYFNTKYGRSGPLFESRYKAAVICDDAYLQHISRYIHLNPRYWKRYPHSSLSSYLGNKSPEWLHPQQILELFGSANEYLQFVSDHEDYTRMMAKLKYELADR